MQQSTTPSLSQTIWPRWASRQFLGLPIVQTLLPVTFGYSLSSQAVTDTIEKMNEALTKVIDTLTQENFYGASEELLERYNKCIAAGGDYFEGDESFICVLSIKVPIQKKSDNLLNDPVYIYIYIYVCVCVFVCVRVIEKKNDSIIISWFRVYIYIYIYTFVCMSVCVCVCVCSWEITRFHSKNKP